MTNSEAVSRIAATNRILLKKQTIIKIERILIVPNIQEKYFIVLESLYHCMLLAYSSVLPWLLFRVI